MLLRLTAILVGLILSYPHAAGETRVQYIIPVASGTPVQIEKQKTLANRMFVQMLIGGTGAGYVLCGIPVGVTPSASTSGQLTAQLAPATVSAPGGSYSDTAAPTDREGIDMSRCWVDGSHTGDLIVVAYAQLN